MNANETYRGLNTSSTESRTRGVASYNAAANMALVIYPTAAIGGTEKQNDYATNLKLEAMKTVDQTTQRMLDSGKILESKESAMHEWRNKLMNAIDAETDAVETINKLKDASRNINKLAREYNIIPQ